MVRIIDYKTRMNSEGEPFLALVVQDGITLVKSKETGLYYATAKKASIPCTFDEATAKAMLGEKVPGTVQKKQCEPYEFTNKETGEVMQLDYRWVYLPEGATIEEAIFEGEPQVELVAQKPKPIFVKV
jgi:hypothetical protein